MAQVVHGAIAVVLALLVWLSVIAFGRPRRGPTWLWTLIGFPIAYVVFLVVLVVGAGVKRPRFDAVSF